MIEARCDRCHRPMKAASPDGLGPKCRKSAKPTPVPAVDLFGFRPEIFAQELADAALAQIGQAFAAALGRLGVA
jgi:hypothetical protein